MNDKQCDPNLTPDNCALITCEGILTETEVIDTTGTVANPLPKDFYFEKIRVLKAGQCSDTLAWNNGIGRWFYFVGF